MSRSRARIPRVVPHVLVGVLAACGGSSSGSAPDASGRDVGTTHATDADAADANRVETSSPHDAGASDAIHATDVVDAGAFDAHGFDAGLEATTSDAVAKDALPVEASSGDAAGQDVSDASAVDATPETPELVASATGAYLVTTDATNVYWSDVNNAYQRPLAGGTVVTLGFIPQSMAVGDAVFFSIEMAPENYTNLCSVPIGGGTETLYKGTVDVWDSAYHPLTAYGSMVVGSTGGGLIGAMTGGMPSSVSSAMGSFYSLHMDATNVYVEQESASAITASILSRGAPSTSTVVISDPIASPADTGLGTLQIDATYVYLAASHYTSAGDNTTLYRAPIAGGNATVLATLPYIVEDLAIDDTNLYWLGDIGAVGAIFEMPSAGGAVRTLVSAGATPFLVDGHVAAGGGYVYFTDGNGLERVAR